MRAPVCAIVAAIGLAAHPAFAQADRTAAAFWKTVQATCDATAAKPPSELGRRIARTARPARHVMHPLPAPNHRRWPAISKLWPHAAP